MKNYTQQEALRNVIEHAKVVTLEDWYYVLSGSCGNKILGKIDYLRNYTDTKIEVITKEQYEVIR